MASETKKPRKDPDGVMSLGDHLRELRNRLLVAVGAIVVFSVVGWIFYDQIFAYINRPFVTYNATTGGNAQLNMQGVTTAFEFKLKIAGLTGVLLATPVWLYEIWAFVMPGLKKTEKRYTLGFLGAAIPLFFGGCWLGSQFIPHAVELLLEFTPSGAANYMPADDYFTFLMKLTLVFGLGFVMPVFIVALNFVGLLKARVLVKGWRWATFLCFLFAAVANPAPDAGSMLVLAFAILALFWLAVGVCYLRERWIQRNRQRKLAENPDDEASTIDAATPLNRDSDSEID